MAYYVNYMTAGGYPAFFNPNEVSHIHPEVGMTAVVMKDGYKFMFDQKLTDFLERYTKDVSEAQRIEDSNKVFG